MTIQKLDIIMYVIINKSVFDMSNLKLSLPPCMEQYLPLISFLGENFKPEYRPFINVNETFDLIRNIITKNEKYG